MAFNYVGSDFSNESFIISGVYASVCKSHQAHLEIDTCAQECSLHPVSALISLANLFGILSSSPNANGSHRDSRWFNRNPLKTLLSLSTAVSPHAVYRCARI